MAFGTIFEDKYGAGVMDKPRELNEHEKKLDKLTIPYDPRFPNQNQTR